MNNKSIIEDYLYKLNKGDISGCLYYIRKKDCEVLQLIDNLGFTILIKVASLNIYEECLEILDIIINNFTKYEFISYINQKNITGFTALHYACYNGNIKLIKLLVNYGADINIISNNGLNVLHLATQGNQTTPLYYFIHKYKMNINSIDNLGNSCLHWACFYHNDNALNFLLLCNKININIRNKNGFTPLHFCVLGNNIKAIKKLITAGADISIKNNENETCINLCIKKNKKEIKDTIIQKNFLIKCNSYTSYTFYLFHLIIPILIILFIMNQLYDIYSIFLFLIWNFLLFVVIYYFNKITIESYLKLKQYYRSDNLLKQIENKNININDYCPRCNIYINNGKNIKHCYICDYCIEGFDHHCIWIGKCLGKNNKIIFLLLLILMELNLLINAIICIIIEPLFSNKYKILCQQLKIENQIHVLFTINLISLIFFSFIIIPLIKNNFKNIRKDKEKYIFKEKDKNIYKKDKGYNESLLNNK